MDALMARVLIALDDAMVDIETRPVPTNAPWWRREADDADRTAGPLWMPSVLLGDADGEAVPDRVRVAAWRAVKKLERLGYVVVKGDGGRHRVKVTDAGRELLDVEETT